MYSIFASSFYQPLRSIDSFSLNQAVFFFVWGGAEGGRGMVWKHHSCSFSLPPPPGKLELISETATGDQVRGPRREKGHELSNMRFLLYRDMQHGDVLAYAERQDIFLV